MSPFTVKPDLTHHVLVSDGPQTYTMTLTEAEAEELRSLVGPGRLRRRRPRMYRENSDYAATVLRMIRSMGNRAAGDPDLLPALLSIQSLVETGMTAAVDSLRAEGYSWADIGSRLGTTRQAAQQRYGPKHRQGEVDTPGV